MAEKRMFAKSIVLSDAFLDMPLSARCLYFTLGMLADDEGFVGNPKSIIRQCGASVDDMNVLLAKRYVLQFESGVIVIKHWKINNYLRNDRAHDTTYLEEKKTLLVDERGAYTEKPEFKGNSDVGIPTVNQVAGKWYTENRLVENRLEENSIDNYLDKLDSSSDKSSDLEQITEMWNTLTKFGITKIRKIAKGSKRETYVKARLKQFTLDDFAEAVEQIKQSSFLQGQNKNGWLITFDWFILPNNFSKVLEGNYNDKKGVRDHGNKPIGIEQHSSGDAERDRKMDEIIKRIESGEAAHDDDGLWD